MKRAFSCCLFLALGAAVPHAQSTTLSAQPSREVPAGHIVVTLLGSGVGPAVNLDQFGASTLVEAGGQRLLFDAGRGATLRLVQIGVPVRSITRVFLTHLHSDHLLQLPDILLTGWASGVGTSLGRNVPLEVWGPRGTKALMDGLLRAFAFDIHIRRDVDEKFPAAGIDVVTREVDQGVVFDEGGVKVTAFLVDHAPIAPAFGYRIDYAGRSVVLSGDTRASENVVRFATGTDVLIHEAFDATGLRQRSTNPAAVEAVIAHHTLPTEAGRIFNRVKPRLAVYSHAQASQTVLDETRAVYSGPLEGAEDLLSVDIAEVITLRHFGR